MIRDYSCPRNCIIACRQTRRENRSNERMAGRTITVPTSFADSYVTAKRSRKANSSDKGVNYRGKLPAALHKQVPQGKR